VGAVLQPQTSAPGGIGGLFPADRYFEIQAELRKTIEQGIAENMLEMALRGVSTNLRSSIYGIPVFGIFFCYVKIICGYIGKHLWTFSSTM